MYESKNKNICDMNTGVRLMKDSSTNDGHCEEVMDYVISWTLRLAQNKCNVCNPNLYIYSRRLLGRMLHIEITPEDEVEVETKKQEFKIDLWVRARINGQNHDILIEDKYLSKLHNNLDDYKAKFDQELDTSRNDSVRHYLILTCKDKCESTYGWPGFEVIAWNEMLSAMSGPDSELKPTGSDIFDEFWINW